MAWSNASRTTLAWTVGGIWVAALFVVLLVVASLPPPKPITPPAPVATAPPEEKPVAPPQPVAPPFLTAEALLLAYESDWDKAHADYTGKVIDLDIEGWLQVDGNSGIFRSTRSRLVDKPFVAQSVPIGDVRSMMQNSGLNAEYVPSVMMELRTGAAPAFAKLRGQKRIVVRGKCIGAARDPKTRPQIYVGFEDCEPAP